MPIIDWNEKLSVNIKDIDTQHQKLISMINQLHDAMKGGKGKEILNQIITQMADYTQQHFLAEEQLFIKHEYPETSRHTREHNAFIEKVATFQRDLNSGHITLSLDVMTFLKDWLVKHIEGTDKKYSPFLNAKGVV